MILENMYLEIAFLFFKKGKVDLKNINYYN